MKKTSKGKKFDPPSCVYVCVVYITFIIGIEFSVYSKNE